MLKYFVMIAALMLSQGCEEKESIITIVDIGHLDRNGIAKELSIIRKHNPRVIGLDFLLTTDSLDKDNGLREELSSARQLIVHATILHGNDPVDITTWDSLETYHSKFRFGRHGFTNLTITDDSVITGELPMRQYYREEIESTFSYMVASAYDAREIDSKYKSSNKDFSFGRNAFGHSFKVISVEDLMTGNFDKGDITDKIVLMGFVSAKKDFFYRDHERTQKISGVEVQACIIRELLN